MAHLALAFESKEESLSVRRFAVHEAMSSLFSVSIWARSPSDDIDFETIVGKAASLQIASGMVNALRGARAISGIISHMEQIQAESTGLSTYYLRLVPRLWLLTQRTNHRIFQHLSIPDMVEKLLKEWKIEHTFKVHRPDYPELEMRSQYGESDFDFLNRLLEEAGISYTFVDDEKKGSVLVLSDAPQANEPRVGGPLTYLDNPTHAGEREHVTGVRMSQQVRPGKVTLRDHDFRRHPTFPFLGHQGAGHAVEDVLEHYKYAPGSFLVEVDKQAAHKLNDLASGAGIVADAVKHPSKVVQDVVGVAVGGTVAKKVGDAVEKQAVKVAGDTVGNLLGGLAGGVAGKIASKIAGELAGKLASSLGIVDVVGSLVGDDRGMARFSEKAGFAHAQRQLDSARGSRRSVTFETNAIDLAPGTVFTMGSHARAELGPEKKLLVTEFSLEGTNDGEWSMSAQAVFADMPYRPPQKTPKPVIQGTQSAVVVGPKGEEIHTDEHGRVRVQFHWDREGKHDEGSSCWMRVSQPWAGSGFGMIAIPRVGQEVLVTFLEGDPDHPVVTGRLYNSTTRVPYDLPAHKTRSGWKSDSSPGSGGFNELMFEDAKGRELVYVQAERDLEKVVKRDEAISVGVDRRTSVGAVDETHVGVRHNVTMRQTEGETGGGEGKIGPTYWEMVDKRICFSTGEASITLDGPNITLEAKGRVFIHSSDDDVEILGGPWVKINCGPAKNFGDTVTSHHITGIVRDQDGEPIANQKIVITGSDGALQQVETSKSGRYFALVPPGTCEVTLSGTGRYGSDGANLDQMKNDPITADDCGPAV